MSASSSASSIDKKKGGDSGNLHLKQQRVDDDTTGSKPAATSAAAAAAVGLKSARHIQFPSPTYFSDFVSDTHAIIGAGGGQRFGMANVIVLIKVDLKTHDDDHNKTASTAAVNPSSAEGTSGTKHHTQTSKPKAPLVWTAVDVLNVGERVPWCSSTFTGLLLSASPHAAADRTTPLSVPSSPIVPSSRVQQPPALFGCFVVSFMDSLSVIRLVSDTSALSATSFGPQRVASASCLRLEEGVSVPLQNDANNPDKKPVAHVLLPPATDSADEEHTKRFAFVAAGQDDNTLGGWILPVTSHDGDASTTTSGEQTTFASAKLDVGCRVNDAACKLLQSQAASEPEILVVATLQAKKVLIAVFTVVSASSCEWNVLRYLDAAQLAIPFPLMRSSLKFARFSSLSSSELQTSVDEPAACVERSVGSHDAVLVVYDPSSGWSYTVSGNIRLAVQASGANGPTPRYEAAFRSRGSNRGVSKLLPEGITCMTPVPSGAGATTQWLAGTVEGSVILLKESEAAVVSEGNQQANSTTGAIGPMHVAQQRCASSSSSNRRSKNTDVVSGLHGGIAVTDALHTEPISSICIAPPLQRRSVKSSAPEPNVEEQQKRDGSSNSAPLKRIATTVVISSDIAQNAVLSIFQFDEETNSNGNKVDEAMAAHHTSTLSSGGVSRVGWYLFESRSARSTQRRLYHLLVVSFLVCMFAVLLTLFGIVETVFPVIA